MIVRPRIYSILTISNITGEAKVYIHLYPQQKWHCDIADNKAHMTYKNIDLCIPVADYEKYWKEV